MVVEWPTTALSELTEPDTPVTYGVVKPGKEAPNGVLFIRGGDISNGRVLTDQLRTISQKISNQYKRTILRGGEIVMSLVGNPGQVAIVPHFLRGANIARQAALVRLRRDIDTRFVFYFLTSQMGQDALGAHSRGSVQQVINLRDLKTIAIPTPPLSEQRAIAHILGTLDDKIELNRRMSETLEAMARALFKSWFVEHPDPSWLRAPLSEWVQVLSGGTPSKAAAHLWGGALKWISPKSMTSIHADECEDQVTEAAIGNGTRMASKGSTLVMVRGMGLHDGVRVSQAREDLTFNQDVKALVPTNIEADLLLFAMLDAQEELHKRVETSGHGTGKMPSEILLAHPISMPPLEAQHERASIFTALNNRIANSRTESRSLIRLRDELLPRLISGELRLANAERILEATR